jgi:hypothetical protein
VPRSPFCDCPVEAGRFAWAWASQTGTRGGLPHPSHDDFSGPTGLVVSVRVGSASTHNDKRLQLIGHDGATLEYFCCSCDSVSERDDLVEVSLRCCNMRDKRDRLFSRLLLDLSRSLASFDTSACQSSGASGGQHIAISVICRYVLPLGHGDCFPGSVASAIKGSRYSSKTLRSPQPGFVCRSVAAVDHRRWRLTIHAHARFHARCIAALIHWGQIRLVI